LTVAVQLLTYWSRFQDDRWGRLELHGEVVRIDGALLGDGAHLLEDPLAGGVVVAPDRVLAAGADRHAVHVQRALGQVDAHRQRRVEVLDRVARAVR
jgi:hypothetical protein